MVLSKLSLLTYMITNVWRKVSFRDWVMSMGICDDVSEVAGNSHYINFNVVIYFITNNITCTILH